MKYLIFLVIITILSICIYAQECSYKNCNNTQGKKVEAKEITGNRYTEIKELKKMEIEENIEVNAVIYGKIRMVGSSRNPTYVLTTDDNVDVYFDISNEVKEKISSYINKNIYITGKLSVKTILYDNPIYNHKKYEIIPEKIEVSD